MSGGMECNYIAVMLSGWRDLRYRLCLKVVWQKTNLVANVLDKTNTIQLDAVKDKYFSFFVQMSFRCVQNYVRCKSIV